MQLNKECKDHKGNSYVSVADMCLAYDIDPTLYFKRIKRGWSLQEALEGKFFYISEDGTKYKTKKDFCSATGISDTTLRNKTKAGYSLDQIYKKEEDLKVSGINNDMYQNTEDLCKAHGVNINTFRKRLQKTGDMNYSLSNINFRKCKMSDILVQSENGTYVIEHDPVGSKDNMHLEKYVDMLKRVEKKRRNSDESN